MEFRISKEDLLRGLTKVQGITAKRTNIPITSNVLLKAEKEEVKIIATDLEIAFQGRYRAEVLKEGICAIPSRKLFEIVKDFPSDVVSVKEQENKWVQIVDEKVEYNIVGMEPEEFPELPNIEGAELFSVDSAVLKDMMEKTIYAVLSDEGRAHLAGVFFEVVEKDEKKFFRMVSTDGHRLSRVDYPMEEGDISGLGKGVIIPKSGVMEVIKILDGKESVMIGVKDKNFIVNKENEGVIIRLIEGDFPDYTLVIPKMAKGELKIKREIFLAMLKRMSIFSSDKYRSVRFTIKKEEMETKTTNPEIGESREVIAVDYNGESIEMAFNPRYFIDAIGSMKSEDIIVKVNDEATPCLLMGKDDPEFLGVIMPMRI